MRASSIFRQMFWTVFLTVPVLADQPDADAWVSQNLISPTGEVITYETPLHTTSGTMSSVPMNGFLARFDLYVYPLAGVDGGDPKPTIVDSEIVGVLPRVTMEFEGRDPHEVPRTRVDWKHTVTTTLLDSPVKFKDPLTLTLPGWVTRLVMRKRFLSEEHVGAEDSEDHWEEYSSLPVLHVSANQEITFEDNAYPPNLTPEERDRWSGIIEYQLALDNVIGNPLPLLTLATLKVRVWPKWQAEFINVPTDAVPQFPTDMRVDVKDIYPGTEKVVVDYFYDPENTGDYSDLVPITLFEEPWSATVAQDRKYSLAALSHESNEGDYHLRVGYLLFGEMEYADDQGDLEDGAVIDEPPGDHPITLERDDLILRAGVFALD